MAQLRGLSAAKEINDKIAEELKTYKSSPNFQGHLPKLGIVRVGERGDDIAYEKSAIKKIESLGMEAEVFSFPADINDKDFKKEFFAINSDDNIDGILLFAPLPSHIDEKAVVELMAPEKDLDGLCFMNQAKLYKGDKNGFAPCTAEAVIRILKSADINLKGKKVTVVGRSMVIGKPVSMLLLNEDATVTICHSKTSNLKEACRNADILIAAIGREKMITADFVSEGTVVIDVGINIDKNGNMCGDVDYDSVSSVASLITPVPGGVGSITTLLLAEHLLTAAMRTKM